MSNRGGDPASIGDAIRSLLSSSRLGAQIEQAEVVSEWRDIVGDQIASVTDARGVTRDGTLLVYVRNNVWMAELSLREPEIVAAIRAHCPLSKVAKVRWMLART